MNETSPFSEAAARAVEEVGEGGGVLLDVRRDDEWEESHAKGALHWELARLQEGELPDIPKDTPLFVHCAAGGRAEQAKEILEQNDWTEVINIGGLKDWETAGGEVE